MTSTPSRTHDAPPSDEAISAYGRARSTVEGAPLSPDELHKIDAYWRASLYLCLGMLYLKANPLLREPLTLEHIKSRLLGHWGSDAGQAFTYIHFNRLIKKYDLNAIYISGPGHGAPAVLSQAYLEGTYSEIYPEKSEDIAGMQRFFKQFSFPGGIGSHATPETPGSIHEGGELGYSISHAYGTVFDHPDLITLVMVGDGESETGPLATSWHSNKFLNPITDGAVLPVLHLNGYKINNPTILARISHDELKALFVGYGYTPYFVEGSDPESMHQAMAATLEHCVLEIREIQEKARQTGKAFRPRWPVVILRSPKGWTAPREVDGHYLEGFWRAHQIPIADVATNPGHLKLLESWLRGYRPEELFDEKGRLIPELKALAPTGDRRMSANPIANGGLLRRPLDMPDFRDYAVKVEKPGATLAGNVPTLGNFLREVTRLNMQNFRVFGPDETQSNRLEALYDVTKKVWLAEYFPEDADGGNLAPEGRVMEMLSEHTVEGWLEGYLLSGRHGLINSYEPFIHVIDSMFNQHAKWLEKCNELPWRAKVSSLNLLITALVWRQDHNGFTHQDPGFLDVVANKSPSVVRIYLPPDANCLLSVADHCLRSVNYVNVIIADKQVHLQYLDIEAAIEHCTKGAGHLGLGEQRPGRRARRGHGELRRLPDDGVAGGHCPAPPIPARRQGPVRECGGLVQTGAAHRASARTDRSRVRGPLHPGQAGRLQFPRLPLADPPAHLPPAASAPHSRARLQGAGQHQHPIGTGHSQPGRPLQPGDRRDRPHAAFPRHRVERSRGPAQPADRM